MDTPNAQTIALDVLRRGETFIDTELIPLLRVLGVLPTTERELYCLNAVLLKAYGQGVRDWGVMVKEMREGREEVHRHG